VAREATDVSVKAVVAVLEYLGDLRVGEPHRPQHRWARGIDVDPARRLHGDEVDEAGCSLVAVEKAGRHATDLEQLGDRLEVRVAAPVGDGQLEVVVFTLSPVQPVLLVGVPPVLERVHDDVTCGLVEAQGLKQAVHPFRGRVKVESPLLVAQPVREAAGAEGRPDSLEARQGDAVPRVEGEVAVLGERHPGGIGRDLAHGLGQTGLGQVGGGDRLLVSARGAGLQSHRERELGAQRAD